MGRSRSQLSPLLRCAWDSGTLRMLDRDRLVQASGGHLSLIGHITQRELAESLHRTEAHNGFANRCLWALAQRTQCLPDGGNVDPQELSAIAASLRRAVERAQGQTEIPFRRDPGAAELWNDYYPKLSQLRSGLHGSSLQLVASRYVTGRGRPTTVWFAIDPACVEPTEEEAAEPDESSEEADLPCLPCTF